MHEPVDEPNNPHWHWAKFPLQNVFWKEAFQLNPGKIFLDIFPRSSKNPSQHPGKGDCLHYCLPGPIDTWVKLIFATISLTEFLSE
jgi:hypothetical protein